MFSDNRSGFPDEFYSPAAAAAAQLLACVHTGGTALQDGPAGSVSQIESIPLTFMSKTTETCRKKGLKNTCNIIENKNEQCVCSHTSRMQTQLGPTAGPNGNQCERTPHRQYSTQGLKKISIHNVMSHCV